MNKVLCFLISISSYVGFMEMGLANNYSGSRSEQVNADRRLYLQMEGEFDRAANPQMQDLVGIWEGNCTAQAVYLRDGYKSFRTDPNWARVPLVVGNFDVRANGTREFYAIKLERYGNQDWVISFWGELEKLLQNYGAVNISGPSYVTKLTVFQDHLASSSSYQTLIRVNSFGVIAKVEQVLRDGRKGSFICQWYTRLTSCEQVPEKYRGNCSTGSRKP